MLPIDWLGERLHLCAARALYWRRRRTLLVADTHFGKDAAFRRAGIPIPVSAMEDDLVRLGRLVDTTAAERVLVLGDFFHARPTPDEPFAAALERWLSARPGVEVCAVPGNHDHHGGAGTLPGLVRWLPEGVVEAPFVFRHEPAADPAGYVLAGHLHPVVRLASAARDRLRLPVLWLSRDVGVLPAFGGFTGGAPVSPAPGDRVWAFGADEVLPIAVGGEPARA
ncbi:MAG: ligase-associated DNA damage response endonuclease PdeM [Gammaproteobacteria bacterium]